MENGAQQSGTDSLHGASLFSSVSFVAVAAMVAAAALCLLPGVGILQIVLPGAGRVGLLVIVIVLGFSGVLVSTLFILPATMRGKVGGFFGSALLCLGFVAMMW